MLENIKIMNKDGEMVVSSREVARNFEKDHKNVVKIIKEKIGVCSKLSTPQYFIENEYVNEQNNQKYKEYLMTRDGFSFLVMGFTGRKADEWKIKYIEAFNKMEETIKNQQTGYQIPKTPMDAIKLMLQVEEQNSIRMDKMEEKISDLDENAPLSPSEYSFIAKIVKDRVRLIKEQYSLTEATKECTKELYKSINRDINQLAHVYTRSQLRKKDFDKVVNLVNIWTPSQVLNMRLKEMMEGV